MRQKSYMRTLLIALVCGLLVASPMIALAQEGSGHEASEETALAEETGDEEPAGVGLFILLIGLVFVTGVGVVMIDRDVYQDEDSSAN